MGEGERFNSIMRKKTLIGSISFAFLCTKHRLLLGNGTVSLEHSYDSTVVLVETEVEQSAQL